MFNALYIRKKSIPFIDLGVITENVIDQLAHAVDKTNIYKVVFKIYLDKNPNLGHEKFSLKTRILRGKGNWISFLGQHILFSRTILYTPPGSSQQKDMRSKTFMAGYDLKFLDRSRVYEKCGGFEDLHMYPDTTVAPSLVSCGLETLGAPAVYDGVLLGMWSWRRKTCERQNPDYFTRISGSLDWIKQERIGQGLRTGEGYGFVHCV